MEAKDFETTDFETTRFVVTQDEKTMAVIVHLAAFAGLAIPFGNILGPLVIWMSKKDEMPFVSDQGKDALNFQITMTIALIVSMVLMLVLVGFLTTLALGLFWLVTVVIAAIRTSEGKLYRYPFTIKFIS